MEGSINFMPWLIAGGVAFLLFYLYDINGVTFENRFFKCSFFAGCALLAAATAGLIATTPPEVYEKPRFYIFSIIAVVFFGLLIYTLFFALPFKETYVENNKPNVYTSGVYALCRHPGVLWLSLFYGFLWLATDQVSVLYAFLLFSLMDLIYVILQDVWIFPKILNGYEAYRKTTPFLVPNYRSISRCFQTMRQERKSRNEI